MPIKKVIGNILLRMKNVDLDTLDRSASHAEQQIPLFAKNGD